MGRTERSEGAHLQAKRRQVWRLPKVKIFFLLILAFFVALVWPDNAQASVNVSSCSSMLVSTSLCNELTTQSCIESNDSPNEPLAKEDVQIQSQILITPIHATPSIPTEASLQQQNLDSNKIFELVNQYRISQGLQAFEPENSICELAQVRSLELPGELANGTIHSGLYNRNLPYWIWENAKIGSNEEETVSWWITSSIHRQSITGDYKYSCVKCQGTSCSQLFTSFSPK